MASMLIGSAVAALFFSGAGIGFNELARKLDGTNEEKRKKAHQEEVYKKSLRDYNMAKDQYYRQLREAQDREMKWRKDMGEANAVVLSNNRQLN